MPTPRVKGAKWLDAGPWPIFIGLCYSQESLDKEAKRLGAFVPNDPCNSAACCSTFVPKNNKSGNRTYIITLVKERCNFRDIGGVGALLAHEATHMVQDMRESLGNLGSEAEAYLIQWVVVEGLRGLKDG